MKIGTKSILFGAHQFVIHPLFVALAWARLYGFPLDPRLWAAFFVHDLGYWGKANMDGKEGERHVELGAAIMKRLFGQSWYEFSLYHSRYYAKRDGQPFSRLCVADKLAMVLEPRWLYMPRVMLSGELKEYMETARARYNPDSLRLRPNGEYMTEQFGLDTPVGWYNGVVAYLVSWIDEHKDGREDSWTRSRGDI